MSSHPHNPLPHWGIGQLADYRQFIEFKMQGYGDRQLCWVCRTHASPGGRICLECVTAEQERRRAAPASERPAEKGATP